MKYLSVFHEFSIIVALCLQPELLFIIAQDDEIRELVSKILNSSSLEDLSIRKVFQQVKSHPWFKYFFFVNYYLLRLYMNNNG